MVYLYICIQSLFIAIAYFSIWIQFLFISIVYFSLLFYIRSFVFNICSFLLYIFRCYSIFDHLYLIINDLYAIVFHLYSMTCIYIPKFSFVFYITVYLDFAKAFDSVAHERLLRKISAYGIKGSVLSWIRDFLTGRRQYVSVKGESSTWKDVVSGVPQGSVLGPVLVIIFINDLPEVVNSIVKIFADDTKLYNKDSNNDIIQQDLDALYIWAKLWQLIFNVKNVRLSIMAEITKSISIPWTLKILSLIVRRRIWESFSKKI